MNTEKMREDFEAWAAKHKHNLNRDGVVVDYACRYTDLAWNSWQASRAAIEVELPGHVCEEEFDDYSMTVGYNLAIDSCANTIESLGLKVKP